MAHVLILDPTDHELLSKTLQEDGYATDVAADIVDVAERIILDPKKYDVVLLEWGEDLEQQQSMLALAGVLRARGFEGVLIRLIANHDSWKSESTSKIDLSWLQYFNAGVLKGGYHRRLATLDSDIIEASLAALKDTIKCQLEAQRIHPSVPDITKVHKAINALVKKIMNPQPGM